MPPGLEVAGEAAADAIFFPRLSAHHGGAPASKASLEAVVASPEDCGEGKLFASATHFYPNFAKGGKHTFVGKATVVRRLPPSDDPCVYWELREFFYRIPWAKNSNVLARYLKKNKDKLDQMLAAYQVTGSEHFKASYRSAVTRADDPGGAEVAAEAEDEYMASTVYVIAFLLTVGTTNRWNIREGALDQLTALAELPGRELPVLVSGGHELPRCGQRPGECQHMKGFIKGLRASGPYGPAGRPCVRPLGPTV